MWRLPNHYLPVRGQQKPTFWRSWEHLSPIYRRPAYNLWIFNRWPMFDFYRTCKRNIMIIYRWELYIYWQSIYLHLTTLRRLFDDLSAVNRVSVDAISTMIFLPAIDHISKRCWCLYLLTIFRLPIDDISMIKRRPNREHILIVYQSIVYGRPTGDLRRSFWGSLGNIFTSYQGSIGNFSWWSLARLSMI